MDSSRNRWWMIPFKKFSSLRVNERKCLLLRDWMLDVIFVLDCIIINNLEFLRLKEMSSSKYT